VLKKKFILYQKIILKTLLIFLAFSWVVPLNVNAAKTNGPERIRSCDDKTGALSTFANTNVPSEGFKEMEYDMSNPTCLGLALGSYAGVKSALLAVNVACNNNPVISPLPQIYNDIKIFYQGLKNNKKLSKPACSVALAAVPTAIVACFLSLGVTLAVAKNEFENVQVCGHDWLAPDPKKYALTQTGSYKKRVTNEYNVNYKTISYDSSKIYRENFHNGKEFEDRPPWGDEWCKDPTTGKPQKYYLRGLHQGDFQCEKYNPNYAPQGKIEEFKTAYKCCLKRRKDFICLEKISQVSVAGIISTGDVEDHIFCQAGKKCAFIKNPGGVTYDIYKQQNNRLVCAKTYNVCPYNFSVKGGTPYVEYYKDGITNSDGKWVPFSLDDNNKYPANCAEASEIRNADCTLNDKAGKIKNYCQYYTHCTVVSPTQYTSDFKNFTPYYARACIDFVGDSQNLNASDSFNPGFGFGGQNNLSAPIVQCIKETMENIFNNTAGHSKCIDGSFGGRNSVCLNDAYVRFNPSGSLIWKKGSQVLENSLFQTLQERLRFVITGILVIAVIFMGAKILLLKVDMTNRKDMMLFILKIGLVLYFVRGDAWRGFFFDGLYNGSTQLSRLFFRIDSVEVGNSIQQGLPSYKCNFGSLYDNNGIAIPSVYDNKYPSGKEYLKVWDTLDCKIMQYLNYGPGFSSGAIFAMIIASFFTGALGVTIGLSIFILAFSLIATVIRAMHIFISSCIAIIIYVFISPIIIPLILFERTKSIFDSWLSQLISFALQPIILFSFLAIFISLSEKILYNGAIFDNGNLICSKFCRSASGEVQTDLDKCKSQASAFTQIYDPQETTPMCIINFSEFDNGNGFAMFGLLFETVPNLNTQKIIVVLKAALFLFVLLKMVDEVPGITSGLTGENIDVKALDGFNMLKKFTANFRSVQKRAARSGKMYAMSHFKSKEKDDDDDDKGNDSKDKESESSDSVSFSDDKGNNKSSI
jgi:type IV secretory pathway VirB6-like protein